MFRYALLYQDIGLLILRVALGAAFIVHGYPKLFKNFRGFSGWLETLGFKPGKLWGFIAGAVEFFGGIALILGLFVQLTAALLTIEMLVAMWKVKWGKMKFVEQQAMGWELDLIYFASALILLTTGPGRYDLGYIFRLVF